jgi:hypothetical protein
MADRTVEELLAAHKAMVAAMSPEELAAHRAKSITIAHLTARVAELEARAGAMFAAQDAYLILPTDRGGPTGPKGTASYKFMQAMAELRAALAKEEPKP